MLYKTLRAPVFDYCDIIYDCLAQHDSGRLQKLENSDIRIICQENKRASVTDRHHNLHLNTLINRQHKHVSHYAYKGINDVCPSNFCSTFVELYSRQCSTIITRGVSNQEVVVPKFKLEFNRKNITFL